MAVQSQIDFSVDYNSSANLYHVHVLAVFKSIFGIEVPLCDRSKWTANINTGKSLCSLRSLFELMCSGQIKRNSLERLL